MSGDRFGPRPGQRWTGSDAGFPESAHKSGDPGTCTHWDGQASVYCLATDELRPYAQGLRCPLHTPARLRGVPEPAELLEQSANHIETTEFEEAA